MRLTKTINLSILAMLMSCGISLRANAATLEVEVKGITEVKGNILVAVFNSKGEWLKKAVTGNKVAAQIGKVVLTIENLPEGEYGISVIHDLNENGKLDSNAIGIPKEPYGFSNDAAGNFGPPSYEEALVKVKGEKFRITVKLS
jgi:uncharacterized protein (DUF2141 family)